MNIYQPGTVLHRETMVAMLRAALFSGEGGAVVSVRFARQAALAWLSAFPGDLEVTLLQAQAMIAEGRPAQTFAALELACRKDPFSAYAYRVLSQACQQADPKIKPDNDGRFVFAQTGLFVLDGHVPALVRLAPWGVALRQAYQALAASDYGEAERRVQDALRSDPDLLLAAALHLLVDRATQDTLTVHRLAEIYHTRWPDCLMVSMVLAETYLELGNEPEAVRLLHLCAANDTTGQVARMLWGEEHPYRSLWPEDPVIVFDLPVPAGVAGRLGWNHLPQGELRAAEETGTSAPVQAKAASLASGDGASSDMADRTASDEEETSGAPDEDTIMEILPAALPDFLAGTLDPEDLSAGLPGEDGDPAAEDAVEIPAGDAPEGKSGARAAVAPLAAEETGADQPVTPPADSRATKVTRNEAVRARRQKTGRDPAAETVQAVSGEFERLAKKLKQPELGRADGRQPVYVIFTSREGLSGQYGPQTAAILDSEMRKLGGLVRQRRGWDAIVYYPDDAASTGGYGLTPVNPRDPWKLKNALADLDGALAKRGEMIGALLIVGGDPIVPFHRLPNPTDDDDGDVPSDSPYATLGANYFVPDWPVGRLPSEKGPDAGLLLEQLRQIQRYHVRQKEAKVVFGLDWGAMLRSIFEKILPVSKTPSFGYTAAVWRRSSLAVFRPIGAPHTVKASPPDHSGSVDGARMSAASLGYYNLHGLADGPAWYGQRDPLEKRDGVAGSDAPDYPVALAPEDLRRNGHAPRVIFSEACYGGYVVGKSEKESLALKFLSVGVLAVIGSTGVSYGSVSTPLIAADLLGSLFWQHLKSGRAAGEALLQARVDLVREMNRRQGFLDGEDQKTLISFVLYGDPLAACDSFRVLSKAIYRTKSHPVVKTVSDRVDAGSTPPQISREALRQVKQLVAEYLPGADIADLHLARQSTPVSGEANDRQGGARPASGGQKTGPAGGNGRTVVTVSKQVKIADHIHHHYVRVTLDEGGKPVKFSTSR